MHLIYVIVLVISCVPNVKLLNYPSDIIDKGYIFDWIEVTTQDGYIIELHHFWSKRTDFKKVLFAIHGVTQNSRSLFQNDAGLEHSLGYYYLEMDYDLWLFNARGNLYSRKHKSLDIESTEFWAYDWNEVGLYDLSATIDYVQNITRLDKINVICFSLGCTELFILLSENDGYNDKIRQVHAMAPSVYLHLFSTSFFVDILKHCLMAASHYIDIFGDRETTAIVTYFYRRVCIQPANDTLNRKCVTQLLKIIEYTMPNVYKRFKFYLGAEPTGSPIKFITHFFQISESKSLRKYDYGPIRNLFVYRTVEPPVYNLTRIRTPVHLYYTRNDELLDSNYFDVLRDNLANVPHCHILNREDGLQHNGFIRHKHATTLVYKLIDYYINL